MSKKYDIYITIPSQLAETDEKLFQTTEAIVNRLKLSISRMLKQSVVVAWKGEANFDRSNIRQIIHDSKIAVFLTHPEFESKPRQRG